MSVSDSLHGITLIVGAGVFGTSTAYHLSQSGGDGSAVIVVDQHDFPTPGADSAGAPPGASHDINKIVRADYTVEFHMRMALEAIEKWRSWDLISPFYHQSGWIVMGEKGDGTAEKMEKMRQNFQKCKGREIIAPLTTEEVKQTANGAFQHVVNSKFERAYSNPEVAWAEADKAVAAMLNEAVNNGVRYIKGKVERLVRHADSTGIKSVVLHDGTQIEADRVLLATGAWTSALMDETEEALNLPDHQRVESQVKAAAVCTVHFSLPLGLSDPYMQVPIFVRRSLGEMLPPPNSGLLKFSNSTSFTNTKKSKSGRIISCPTETSQFDVPEALKQETLEVVQEIMPQLLTSDVKTRFFRICWDAVTPEQHQLITQHPSADLNNLFLATGGSFHSWKFLPTIGSRVANVLRGISNGKEMDEVFNWKIDGWSASTGRGAHSDLIPKREFCAFLDAQNGKS